MNKNGSIFARALISLVGLREVWRRERSFRALGIAVAVAFLALALLGASPGEWAIAIVIAATALGMETMNAALEALADRMHPDHHREIGAAKDMASGAVFIVNCVGGGLIAWIVLRHLL
jgi:diacylglycerol kinase (ATP)